MTIKQLGGVFGRNPTFNDVTIEGELTFDGDIDINSDLKISQDFEVVGDSGFGAAPNSNYRINALDTSAVVMAVSRDGTDGDAIQIFNGAVFGTRCLGLGVSGSNGTINNQYGNIEITTSSTLIGKFTANGFAPENGKGIDFSATAGTGTSELLDDYEEGDWTGTFSDGTNDATMSASFTTGQYVKIGSMVMVSGYFVNTSIGSMSGAVRITGLPFPSGNANSYSAGGGCAYGASLAITANQSISTYLAKNTDYINLMLWDGAAGASTLQASELSDGGQIVFSLTYIAA
jgi:hypothetical protein